MNRRYNVILRVIIETLIDRLGLLHKKSVGDMHGGLNKEMKNGARLIIEAGALIKLSEKL